MRRVLIALIVIWIVGYIVFRQVRTEVWTKDNHAYVIFPTGNVGLALYYLWRPLSYADGALTGKRFHIGPH